MILLDTHTWIWWVCQYSKKIPPNIDRKIRNGNEKVYVTSVSCLEIALLVKKGKIELSKNLNDWFILALKKSGIQLLPLTPEIAARINTLPEIHRDPIDRVIIASAIEHKAVLITKDSTIQKYPELEWEWG